MKPNRIAIIDLGTNTFNLLITEVAEDGKYNILMESKIPAKLGEGGIHESKITPEAIERGLEALRNHLITVSEYQVESIFCFATSAIRNAENRDQFLTRVRSELGLSIRIIHGDEEAQTIFDGIRQVFPIDEQYILIVDIGGGSVEFIISNSNGVAWKQSFETGVARLLEIFNPSDPIQEHEMKAIQKHLRKELDPLFHAIKEYPVQKMVGSSGSFDTLAALLAHQYYPLLDTSKLTSLRLEKKRLAKVHHELMASSADQRRVMPGMVSYRVESIIPASIIVQFLVEELKIGEVWQCSFALKEGAVFQIISGQL